MSEIDLQAEFAQRGPWVTKHWIGGEAHGGDFDALGDLRLPQFWEAFPLARTILELGSLEGGHSFALAAHPTVERLVGVEGRQANVARAEWVRTLLGASNVEFVQADLESTSLSTLGTFDVVFCCGLLYHLQRPWELIAQIGQVSSGLFLSTHYAAAEQANTVRHGVRGTIYQEFGLDDPLSGLSDESFWPTLDGLLGMLRDHGFTETNIVHNIQVHPNGPIVNLSAFRRGAAARKPAERLRSVMHSFGGLWKSLRRL